MKIFLSCQHTSMVLNKLQKNDEVRASSPPFNILKTKSEFIKHYDYPVFGYESSLFIFNLFQRKELSCLHKLKCGINPIFKLKVKQIKKHFIKYNRIIEFLTKFEALDITTIRCFDDWNEWIIKENKIDKNWSSKLHIDNILTLFEIETNEISITNLKWLSRIVSAYGLIGCLTDIINLKYALNITNFDFEDQKNIWIPDLLIHDGETDDLLCVVLLKYLNPNLKIIMQLPIDKIFDIIEIKFNSQGWTILRDPESKNQEQLIQLYNL